MSDSTPSSPVPSSNQVNTTENTRLLDTSASSYAARDISKKQTVINIEQQQQQQQEEEIVQTTGLIYGGGLTTTTLRQYETVIAAGQPTIPTEQLTEKIQDILVFTEIKQNQQARAMHDEKKRKIKEQIQEQEQLYQQKQELYLQQLQQQFQNQSKEEDQPQVPPPLPYKIENLVLRSHLNNSSSSSSDSDSDSDEDSVRFALKRKLTDWSIDHGKKKSTDGKKTLRKRDFAVDALRFATSNWKEKHGYATNSNNNSSSSLVATTPPPAPAATSVTTTTTTTIPVANAPSNNNKNQYHHHTNGGAAYIQQVKKQEEVYKPIPSSAESVFEVAKNASVCAVLALLHERRQSSGFNTETDVSLQTLALSTLNFGLKVQDKSVSHVVLYEMLTNKWMHGKSALEWAVENNSQLILSDARVQLVIEDLWKSGPNWRQDPNHPSNIWLEKPPQQQQQEPKNFGWYVITEVMKDFLARCASIRYQTLIGFFTMLVYLSLHLATVTNQEYRSDIPFAFEYVFFTFVSFDFLLEYYTLFTQPIAYLRKVSSYVSLLTASLLLSACVIRIFALIVIYNVEVEAYFLTLSYALVVLSTPLMFFRLFVSATDLCWSIAKTSFILYQCFVNSLWVFSIALFILLGFWVALAALQFDDIRPFTMLRYLVFGALHAPAIGSTISYQKTIAGFLLAVYLFLTVIILGALLTASFLSTILDIQGRIESVKKDWAIRRCLGVKPRLGVFIPSVPIDFFFGFVQWTARVVFKRQASIEWVEKTHQVLWYLIYSPILLVVGLYELITTVLFKWTLVVNTFKREPTGSIRI